ncbi:hypothetical protein LZG75_12090 [Polynucleobacter sp. IMCC30063]|uniref:hypothetical protein n=1 Tax=Polynucleobacter sp. IMCC30063 TaxID=2907298 RepID=UPI001F38F5AB|nr:hypothetical protein [Polynucleobacter sp. IMCC30063]MCE7506969.1 hypothetical protein [Polynucleobacter sp. IMCC30063]
MSLEEAYLFGLIAGRGHIYADSSFIAIEFSHANEFVEGIAHCHSCGDLATKTSTAPEGKLVCKNASCKAIVDASVKKQYNQPAETAASLKDVIIPFLSSAIPAKYEVSGNKAMTLLLIDFSSNPNAFARIIEAYSPEQSFDNFHIPEIVNNFSHQEKIEFINGLLDTSGFANAGGWLNRDGENLHGRMRAYFQIVRNWHMPVEIDNFLRKHFKLPTHTIDWGHPNIRDGNLTEVYGDEKAASWSREHQIKFFPEYYGIFKFRISSKQALFQELLNHNIAAGFSKSEDWFPPSQFSIRQVKANHPGESDPRIPLPARRHVNAFWQLNLFMGCEYLGKLQSECQHPEMFALNGSDEFGYEELKTLFEERSKKLHDEKYEAYIDAQKRKSENPTTTTRRRRTTPEADTYPPLVNFFTKHLSKKYSQDVLSFDTSSGNLNAFLKNNAKDLLETFENCEKFRIRPDVVAFLSVEKRLAFIESKVTPLDLSALGQLVGYCLVAKPIEAILVSTQPPSPSFIRILKANKSLLEYEVGRYIQIATLLPNEVVEFTPI